MGTDKTWHSSVLAGNHQSDTIKCISLIKPKGWSRTSSLSGDVAPLAEHLPVIQNPGFKYKAVSLTLIQHLTRVFFHTSDPCRGMYGTVLSNSKPCHQVASKSWIDYHKKTEKLKPWQTLFSTSSGPCRIQAVEARLKSAFMLMLKKGREQCSGGLHSKFRTVKAVFKLMKERKGRK